MSQPIAVMVKRFRCPFCSRSRAKRSATAEHTARCWRNPAVRACLTCKHFEPVTCCGMPDLHQCYTPMCPDSPACAKGISLAGRPACQVCNGLGMVQVGPLDVNPCPECDGSDEPGAEFGCSEVKPGPISGCHEWEPSDPPQDPMVAPVGAGKEWPGG